MKKRIISTLCALSLLLSLAVTTVAAAEPAETSVTPRNADINDALAVLRDVIGKRQVVGGSMTLSAELDLRSYYIWL